MIAGARGLGSLSAFAPAAFRPRADRISTCTAVAGRPLVTLTISHRKTAQFWPTLAARFVLAPWSVLVAKPVVVAKPV